MSSDTETIREALKHLATAPTPTKAQKARGYISVRIGPEWIAECRAALAGSGEE